MYNVWPFEDLSVLFGTMELLLLTSFFVGVPGLFTDIQLDVIDELGCPKQVLFVVQERFCRRQWLILEPSAASVLPCTGGRTAELWDHVALRPQKRGGLLGTGTWGKRARE